MHGRGANSGHPVYSISTLTAPERLTLEANRFPGRSKEVEPPCGLRLNGVVVRIISQLQSGTNLAHHCRQKQ